MNILPVVITASRPQKTTLPDTLSSLQQAGFIPPIVVNDSERRGCYWNWRRAAYCAIEHSRTCSVTFNYALLCEDDVALSLGLRRWLDEDHHWPIQSDFRHRFVASLYTARQNHREAPGWFHATRLPKQASGALATLWPVHVLREFTEHVPHPEWDNRTDHAIGLFCRNRQVPYLLHSPSLVRHTAVHHGHSALRSPGGRVEDRQCQEFVTSLVGQF